MAPLRENSRRKEGFDAAHATAHAFSPSGADRTRCGLIAHASAFANKRT
jgi:hypothetical protein